MLIVVRTFAAYAFNIDDIQLTYWITEYQQSVGQA